MQADKHSTLSAETREQIKRAARNAKYSVLRGDTRNDVEWHLAERSHQIGIVSAQGMIDLTGERANYFRTAYRAVRG